MSSSSFDFQFKQFGVNHSQCAMKVNTDGILLGAWANLDNAERILDIGTGSGLIALMCAQRSCIYESHIFGLEIEPCAATQAKQNFIDSPWRERLRMIHADLLSWHNQSASNIEQFDVIVSNPPYFSNSLKSQNTQKRTARHNDTLTFDQLLNVSYLLAKDSGQLSLILPTDESKTLQNLAPEYGWFLKRETRVASGEGKPAIRAMMEFTKEKSNKPTLNSIFIRSQNGEYSDAYIDLCRAFYLKM